MFGTLGPWEIVLVLLVALLIFGGRLPHVAKNLGKGIVEFKKGLKGVEDSIDESGKNNDRQLKDAEAKVKEEEKATTDKTSES
ncbi:MAG: twin-arginine translocase TatA/TatE family subunit [Planctomycetota bacterium]